MNFYMFVNRENWQGAPVDEHGQPSETYDVPKRVMSLVRRIGGFTSLRKSQDVAVMYYRPYAWEAYVVGDSKVIVDGMELGRAYRLFERSYTALLALGYDPAIVDPFVDGDTDISTYRLIVVPSSGYMDEQTQRLLRSYVEGGGIMVFCPVLPIMDLDFKPCWHFGRDVEYAGATPCPKSPFGERVVGRGKIILVQDDWLSDEGRDEKACDLDVLGSLLASQGLVPEVGVEDQHITGVIHRNEFERILFVVDTIPKPREVHLAFRDITTGSLEEILPGDAVLAIRRGVTTLATEGTTVRVFRLSEQI